MFVFLSNRGMLKVILMEDSKLVPCQPILATQTVYLLWNIFFTFKAQAPIVNTELYFLDSKLLHEKLERVWEVSI